MNAKIGSRFRNRHVLMLAATGIVAGTLLLSVLNGVPAASADGGVDSASQQNNVGQQYEEPALVNTCFFGIPC